MSATSSAGTAVAAPAPAAAPAATPAAGAKARRAPDNPRSPRFWIVLGGILVAVVVLVLLIGRGSSAGQPLAGDNAGPSGAKAVVEVLREHGVRVTVAGSFSSAVAHAVDATVLIYDPNGFLDAEQLRQLSGDAASIVMVEPGFAALQTIAPDVHPAGAPARTDALTARCTVGPAARAGTISGADLAYRSDGGAARSCFPTGGGAAAMVVSGLDGGQVTVVGSTRVFANESVTANGNAALALGLLGVHADAVWYLPTATDVEASGPPSLAELTPGWVTPAALLGIAVFVAAAVWRGRRFGPLVIERLPVVVRAEETMEGRARLYQRSSARLRALDALRIGATGRIATAAGLPQSVDLDTVIAAAADLSGRPPGEVRLTVVDAVPRSDADLMRWTARLDELEARVKASARPSATEQTENPNGRMTP